MHNVFALVMARKYPRGNHASFRISRVTGMPVMLQLWLQFTRHAVQLLSTVERDESAPRVSASTDITSQVFCGRMVFQQQWPGLIARIWCLIVLGMCADA